MSNGQVRGMAQMKKNRATKDAIDKECQRTMAVCARFSRPILRGAQRILRGRRSIVSFLRSRFWGN